MPESKRFTVGVENWAGFIIWDTEADDFAAIAPGTEEEADIACQGLNLLDDAQKFGERAREQAMHLCVH